MDRILMQIFRMFLNRGINKGINHVANRGRNPKDMTPAERQEAKAARETARRAKQAIRLGRRFGKF